jgi:multidrug efflux system outer membrane protein
LNALAILCGKSASEFTLEHRPLAGSPPEIPGAMPSTLLQRRPDVVLAERSLAATNEEIGVAQAAFFPTFSLTASGGVESKDLSSLFEWPSTAWQLAGNIAQPIFTGGRNRAELDAARARYDQALAAYRQQVLVAFKDVEDALLDIQFLAEQAKALDEAVEAARQVTALATKRYEQGQVSYLDVVDAQRQQLEVEQQSVLVLGQRMAAAAHLSKALGGGWNGDVGSAPAETRKAQDETQRPDHKRDAQPTVPEE